MQRATKAACAARRPVAQRIHAWGDRGGATVLRGGRCALAVVWSAAGLLLAAPLWGTTVVAKDLTTLCEEADVAFVGTVADVRSQWADPEQQRIETLATFAQLTPLYGNPGDEITLRFPGGEIEGMREEVAGLPRFRIADLVHDRELPGLAREEARRILKEDNELQLPIHRPLRAHVEFFYRDRLSLFQVG